MCKKVLKDHFSSSSLYSFMRGFYKTKEWIWSHGVCTGKYLHQPDHSWYLCLNLWSVTVQGEFSSWVPVGHSLLDILCWECQSFQAVGIMMGCTEEHKMESSLIRVKVTYKTFHWKLGGWGLVVVLCWKCMPRCEENHLLFWDEASPINEIPVTWQ